MGLQRLISGASETPMSNKLFFLRALNQSDGKRLGGALIFKISHCMKDWNILEQGVSEIQH